SRCLSGSVRSLRMWHRPAGALIPTWLAGGSASPGWGLVRMLSMRRHISMLGSVLLLLGACGSSGEQPGSEGVEHYLAAVTSGDGMVVGQRRSGSLPSGSGPAIQATTSGAVLPGASRSFTVTSTSAVDRIVVGVDGAPGYYELTGLTLATTQSLLL